jgi:peptide/nickel transport system substrate-binding protein
MSVRRRFGVPRCVAALALCAMTLACASQDAGPRAAGAETAAANSAPRRIVAAVMVEPQALFRPLIPGAYIIQVGDLVDSVVHMSLTTEDDRGIRRAALAEAVPTLENGLWRLLPDGQMGLVWRIRQGAQWHDGTAFTADDLLFTMEVAQEPTLPEFRSGAGGAFELIDRVTAVDPQTISVTWKTPFIRADGLFSTGLEGFAEPLPRHLLGALLGDNRETFLQSSYWTREYIGLGPYKLREWAPGSHLTLDANDRYVLGRPKIDEMQVRFVLDANTLSANLLAGAVEVTLGTGLSLEQSLEVRDSGETASSRSPR